MEAVNHDDRVTEIDSWLPQTQCTKCGYPRCSEYAGAIADGNADINQCPPGGDATICGLAAVTGATGKPLNPVFGLNEARKLAQIDEAICIGCVMCIQACPVDAIIGAAKLMHSVVPNLCTGCGLCIEPCPVDCISMKAITPQIAGPDWRWEEYSPEQTSAARKATEARHTRIAKRSDARSSEKRLRELRRSQGRGYIRQEIRAAVERRHASTKNKRSGT